MKACMIARYFGAVSIRRHYRASGWTCNVEEWCPKAVLLVSLIK